MSSSDLDDLQSRLGYRFKNLAYLESALTHRSVGPSHNERLEFLGDSIGNFVIAEALFRRYPEAREGKLTRMRASLVRGQSLSQLARQDCNWARRFDSGVVRERVVVVDEILFLQIRSKQ